MTDKQPDVLRQAAWLKKEGASCQRHYDLGVLIERLHSENETLRVERERNLDSIRVNNEIINKQRDENETLQAGYAAARLEIESLQVRIKTMAEEHADELMVAHMDGRMRAAQPAGAQQPDDCGNTPYDEGPFTLEQQPVTVYADLMQAASDWICEHVENGTPGVMIWAIRLQSAAQKLRASHGQAPAQAAPAAMHSDLRARCVEVLAWRETGTLPGEALRTLAREKYGDRYDAIQRAERDTETEALNLVAAAPTTQPAPQTSPASHGNVTEVLDIPDQCPYSGPSSHRDVWLAGWYAARRQARSKP